MLSEREKQYIFKRQQYQHSGPENLKKSRTKTLVKSNKSISQKKIFDCNFKNGQKSIFELGKSLKLPKMQFHEKNGYI